MVIEVSEDAGSLCQLFQAGEGIGGGGVVAVDGAHLGGPAFGTVTAEELRIVIVGGGVAEALDALTSEHAVRMRARWWDRWDRRRGLR